MVLTIKHGSVVVGFTIRKRFRLGVGVGLDNLEIRFRIRQFRRFRGLPLGPSGPCPYHIGSDA